MATDRGALRELLAEQGQEAVMDRLEPFFRKADRKFYDLAGKQDVVARLSAESIRCLGYSGGGFEAEFVSFEELAARAADRTSVWDDLVAAVSPRLRQDIGRRYNEKLDAYLGSVMRQRLGEVLWPALGFDLWHSFQNNRWDAAGQLFKLEAKGLVLRTVEYYVGFSLSGDETTASALADLVDAFQGAIILGRREGSDDRYVTLVA